MGIDESAPVFGHVGRFDPVKNHRFLLETFACILRREPTAKLVLAGKPDNGAVRAYARELGVEDDVFLGVRDDVARVLCAFDVFVFTSFKEGLGMAVVEAQRRAFPASCRRALRPWPAVSDAASFLDLDQGARHGPIQRLRNSTSDPSAATRSSKASGKRDSISKRQPLGCRFFLDRAAHSR